MSVQDTPSPNPDVGSSEKRGLCKLCRSRFLGHLGNVRRKLQDILGINVPVPRLGSRPFNYGTITDIGLRKDCLFCSFIAKLIITELMNDRGKEFLGAEQKHWCIARNNLWTKNGFQILSAQGRILVDIKIINLPIRPIENFWSHENYIDWMQHTRNGELMDTRRIRHWLQDCENNPGHGFDMIFSDHRRCHTNENRNHSKLDLLLIDVGHFCLVSADSTCRYITLSYVWGNMPFLKTTTHNLPQLRKEGALVQANGTPTVITDAILLTRSIGEKYLWVDALCLVQNDNVAKYRGINQMHKIFAQACLTIVAASARDAYSCLPGVRSATRLSLVSDAIGGIQLTKAMPSAFKEYTGTIHQSRGWTFQEILLSRRCLIITYDQLYFRCLSNLRCEMDEVTHDNLNPSSKKLLEGQFRLYGDYHPMQPKVGQKNAETGLASGQNNNSSLDPYISLYANLVESYTHRHLTFEADVLNAFAALQATLSKQMKAGFAFGMPLANLGKALLWTTKHQGAPRRHIDHEIFPSWSWISWQNQVQWTWPIMPYEYFVFYYIKQDWSFVELVDTRCVVVIESPWTESGYEHQSDTSAVVRLHRPQGLLCFTAQSVSSKCFLYRHATVDQTVAHLPNHNTEIVPRYKLAVGTNYRASPPGYDMVQQNPDGLGRGIIFSLDSQTIIEDQSLEFIALSYNQPLSDKKGKSPRAHYHFNGPSLEQNSCLPFLNCLLIRWHGNVAERVAYAQIGSTAWEAATPIMKEISLV